MKHVSNEQKVKEICGCADCGNPLCYEFGGDGYCFEYNRLIKLAKWKDARHKEQRRIIRNHYQEWAEEQIAQEKQKLIDEACKWLEVNDSYAKPTHLQVDRLREHLNNIKWKGE